MQISALKGSVIIVLATALMAGVGYWWWQAQTHVDGRLADPEAVRLYEAINSNALATVEDVLRRRGDLVKFKFGSEGTALHVAARLNQPQLVRLLMERGADVTARGEWDGTPLHWACWWGSVAAVDELLKHKPPLEDKQDLFGSTPLLWTCHGSANAAESKGDYLATLDALMKAGAQAETSNADGVRAIDMASEAVVEAMEAKGVAPPTTRPTPSTQPLPEGLETAGAGW